MNKSKNKYNKNRTKMLANKYKFLNKKKVIVSTNGAIYSFRNNISKSIYIK